MRRRAVLNAKDGVVRIFCEVDDDIVSGSGFLVTNTNSGAVVVTNYHVVQGASEMQLYYDGNGPVDLAVIAISEGQGPFACCKHRMHCRAWPR